MDQSNSTTRQFFSTPVVWVVLAILLIIASYEPILSAARYAIWQLLH